MGRLTNFFNKRSIDSRLLTGELSPDSGAGKARAERLVDRRHRARSAKALRELVEEAHRDHPSMFNANLPVQFLAIREHAALILTLARELEELAEVDPRGVILADRLTGTHRHMPARTTGSSSRPWSGPARRSVPPDVRAVEVDRWKLDPSAQISEENAPRPAANSAR